MLKGVLGAAVIIPLCFCNTRADAQTRCPDLTGDYDCGGCNALGIGNDQYIVSHAGDPGGHTTIRPDGSDPHLWIVVPGPGWEDGGFGRTSNDCKSINFGRSTWHRKE